MSFQPDAIDSKSDLMELLGSSPSKSQSPTVDSKSVQTSENAFSEQSAAFWVLKGKDLYNAYEKGVMISNYNPSSKYEYESFLTNLIRLLEEIVREELIKKEHTLEEIKNIIKSIEELIKVLSFNLNNKVKPDEIKVKTLIAALHGFINSYSEKVK